MKESLCYEISFSKHLEYVYCFDIEGIFLM